MGEKGGGKKEDYGMKSLRFTLLLIFAAGLAAAHPCESSPQTVGGVTLRCALIRNEPTYDTYSSDLAANGMFFNLYQVRASSSSPDVAVARISITYRAITPNPAIGGAGIDSPITERRIVGKSPSGDFYYLFSLMAAGNLPVAVTKISVEELRGGVVQEFAEPAPPAASVPANRN